MNNKLTFCEECRNDVTYYVEDIVANGKLKGCDYEFVETKAICCECGAEVYVANIEDANLKALYNAYRKKNGIISLEKILEIPQKYGIGKRPLSLLLGWGEMTFSRYCDGDMPTVQYSKILQNIYDEPAYYLSLLEENNKNLNTQKTYEKSKRITLELINGKKVISLKVEEVIDYLLFRCEDITPLALQKALYYVQGFFYAFMGSYMFAEDCEAWVHGPVYREIYNRYASYRFDPIEGDEDFNISVFTDAEKAIIDNVVQNLCCYSGIILERFTHAETPWLKTRGNLPADSPSNRVINKEDIGEYFVAVKQKYNMLSPNDIENYAQVMFRKSAKC